MKRLFVLLVLAASCQAIGQSIVGLWSVDLVTMGNEEMTPNSKWIEFHADGTQRGGNGWKQHSIGSYLLTGDQLQIRDENGLEDEFGGFKVEFTQEGNMIWRRMEGEAEVVVHVSRADSILPTDADLLLGAWELDSISGSFDLETMDQKVMYRWDQVVVWSIGGDKACGTYRVHGHMNRVEHCGYDNSPREYWNFNGDVLTLSSRPSEEKGIEEVYYFSRTHQF